MAKILSSIDIGSNSIVCLSASVNGDGKLCIKAASIHESEGIKNGNIVDIQLATKSILNAIAKTEKMLKQNINTLVVGISGGLLKSRIVTMDNTTNLKKVTKKDIFLLAKSLANELKESHKEPIHIIPLSSSVNGVAVNSPIGMNATQLSVDFHTVYINDTILNNIAQCFKSINLKVDNFVSNIYASAITVLNEDEKTQGALVINMGADITSFSIIRDNKFIFEGSVDMAGNAITMDIANVLNVSNDLAESIKVLNANFYLDGIDANEIIKIDIINNDEESFRVAKTKKSVLNDIIKARIEEIVNIIFNILNKKGLDELFSSVVLMGGTANIDGIDDYVENMVNIRTRVGRITDFYVATYIDKKQLEGPSYISALGLLFYLSSFYKNNRIEEYNGNESIFNKIINFLINLFIS